MTPVQRPLKLIEPRVDDVDAFASVYAETAARVYGVVLRVVRDPVQADEVTRDVYLEIWRQVARHDLARGSVVARLMRIAQGKAEDRVRSVGPSTSETAERSQNARVVSAALSGLSVKQRQVLELAYFCGHSHAEVARLLGIPLGTAQGRITAGLVQLRQSFLMDEAESRLEVRLAFDPGDDLVGNVDEPAPRPPRLRPHHLERLAGRRALLTGQGAFGLFDDYAAVQRPLELFGQGVGARD